MWFILFFLFQDKAPLIANLDERPPLDETQFVERLYEMINELRGQRGIPPLIIDANLAAVARAHSEHMAAAGFFANVDPHGNDPLTRVQRAGYGGAGVTVFQVNENIFRIALYSGSTIEKNNGKAVAHYRWYQPREIARKIIGGWTSREAPLARMLSERHTHMGIGITIDAKPRMYVTLDIAAALVEPVDVLVNAADKPTWDLEPLAGDMLAELNRIRDDRELPRLISDPQLQRAAAEHAAELAREDYLDHVNRAGEDTDARATRHGFSLFQVQGDIHIQQGLAEILHKFECFPAVTKEIRDGRRLITYLWHSREQMIAAALADLIGEELLKRHTLDPNYEQTGLGLALNAEGTELFLVQAFVGLPNPQRLLTEKPANMRERPKLNGERIGQLVHQRINQIRRAHGLPQLAWEPRLVKVAAVHSRDMARHLYFRHRDRRGQYVAHRAPRMGFREIGPAGAVAENIFRDYLFKGIERKRRRTIFHWSNEEEVAEACVDGWMNSPPHRANILRPLHEKQGVAFAVDKHHRYYATQVFY